MASSYSTDLKLELMATGENAGTWGDKTNTNLNLVQQAIAGFEQVTLSAGGTTALVMSDGALSNARNLVIKFATITATSGTICTIPDSIEKFYIFDVTGVTNPTNLTIKTASGTGFSPDAQKIYAAYSDGTNLNEVSLDTLGGSIGTAQIADDAVTFAKMQDTTTANRVLGAVSAGTIGEVQVQTAMIADDAVNGDKLANTSVSAGTYTNATVTVDAQGRITGASSGAGGAVGYVPNVGTESSGSSSITTGANTAHGLVYLVGAGGGGGAGQQFQNFGGGSGGSGGGKNYVALSLTGSTSYPYAVGAGGNGGTQRTGFPTSQGGNAGGASTFASPAVVTSNGGNGGTGGRHANGGSSPGSPGSSGNQSINTGTQEAPANSVNGFSGGNPGSGGPGTGTGSPGGAGAFVLYEA